MAIRGFLHHDNDTDLKIKLEVNYNIFSFLNSYRSYHTTEDASHSGCETFLSSILTTRSYSKIIKHKTI